MYYLEDYEEALNSYKKALEINPDYKYPYFNSIEILFKFNRWQEGFLDLEKSLERFANSQDSHKIDIAEYINLIWESSADIKIWKSRLQNLLEIFDKYQIVSLLSKGIVDNIPNLMSDIVSNKAARSWLELWQEIAGDKTELQIAFRFLKTAVEYKENPGDRKVLLQLPKEERSLLESLLQDKTTSSEKE